LATCKAMSRLWADFLLTNPEALVAIGTEGEVITVDSSSLGSISCFPHRKKYELSVDIYRASDTYSLVPPENCVSITTLIVPSKMS
jgi:hypothetical protein